MTLLLGSKKDVADFSVVSQKSALYRVAVLSTSQEIGWEKCLQNDLLCQVGR